MEKIIDKTMFMSVITNLVDYLLAVVNFVVIAVRDDCGQDRNNPSSGKLY